MAKGLNPLERLQLAFLRLILNALQAKPDPELAKQDLQTMTESISESGRHVERMMQTLQGKPTEGDKEGEGNGNS